MTYPGGGWGNPIVGGTSLRIPAITSPNFNLVTPSASPTPSWGILQSGLAYFFGLTLTGGTITGPDYIINTAGIFLYSGTPANGNLIGSWAGTAGTDAFGNVYPAGLSVAQGAITGALITNTLVTASTWQGGTITNATITAPTINGGTATEIAITFDNNGGVMLVYATSTTTVSQTVAGTYQFTGPANVTSGKVECQGAGTGGNGGTTAAGGHGGGAGEYAQEPQYPLVAGTVYTYVVGAGTTGQSTGGGDAGDAGASFFDNGGVFANGGLGNGTGGTGSVNTVHNNGGSGGNGSSSGGAGGGGGSGGSTSAGGNAANASSGSGTAGGAAGTGGGAAGGAGGNNAANGSNGSSPGGAGGGAGKGSTTTTLTKSYSPVWTGSYYGPDGTTPNLLRSTTTMYQGGETASGGGFNGNQRCVFAFNRTQIASDFAGFTVTNCTITVTNQHSWFNSGMTIEFDQGSGLPGSAPGTWPGGMSEIVQGNIAEGATHTYGLGASVGQGFVTGTTNGLGFGTNVAANNPYNLNYYGYFSNNITLTITGTSGAGGSQTAGNGSDGEVKITYATATALLATIAPAAGTDVHGNAYKAGIWVYGNSGSAVGMIPSGNNTALAFVPGVTPAAVVGTALMYGTGSGGVNLVDGSSGDGNTYALGRRTLVSGGGSITTGLTTVFSSSMTVRSYRVSGRVFFNQGTAAGTLHCSINGTFSAGDVGITVVRGAATPFVGFNLVTFNSDQTISGATAITVQGGYILAFDGVVVVSSNSTFAFQLAISAGTLTVLANSYIDIEPVL